MIILPTSFIGPQAIYIFTRSTRHRLNLPTPSPPGARGLSSTRSVDASIQKSWQRLSVKWWHLIIDLSVHFRGCITKFWWIAATSPSGKKVLHAPSRGTVETGTSEKRDGQEIGRQMARDEMCATIYRSADDAVRLEPSARGWRIRSDVEQQRHSRSVSLKQEAGSGEFVLNIEHNFVLHYHTKRGSKTKKEWKETWDRRE